MLLISVGLGLIVIVAGVLVIRFRVLITKSSVEGQRKVFGKTVGDISERRTSPLWTGIVGGGAIVFGALMIVVGFVRY